MHQELLHVSQITTCRGRVDDVRKNIDRWLQQPIQQLVLVLYGSHESEVQEIKSLVALVRDARVNVIWVHPREAGPFFSQARARNIGASEANNPVLLFLDADCRLDATVVEDVANVFYDEDAEKPLELACFFRPGVDSSNLWSDDNWVPYRQFFVHSSLFFGVNGFNENQTGWGGESEDFFLRASSYLADKNKGAVPLVKIDSKRLKVSPTDKEARFRFSPRKFDDLQKAYESSEAILSGLRKMCIRANPDRSLYRVPKNRHNIRVWVSGFERGYLCNKD